MKESILIEMRNKVDALTRVIQQIIYDINETKDLSRGTLEVLKKSRSPRQLSAFQFRSPLARRRAAYL